MHTFNENRRQLILSHFINSCHPLKKASLSYLPSYLIPQNPSAVPLSFMLAC